MTWSLPQRRLFVRSASAAGMTDAQRYLVMRHVGCPIDARLGRPSVKHPRNSNEMFEQAMAVVEAQAAVAGVRIRAPRECASWRIASQRSHVRALALARAIVREAISRMPERFDAGLERYIVEHTTGEDPADLVGLARPRTLDECDGGQLRRVIEALRAYVGREFVMAGIEPASFAVPPGVHRRVCRSSAGPSRPQGGGPA